METAYEIIGKSGKFQIILIIFIIPSTSIAFFLSIGFPFLTSIPILLCKFQNATMIPENIENSYRVCPDIIPKHTYYVIKDPTGFDNFVYKFDLYYQKQFFIHIIASAYFIGQILGNFILSTLPDKYGRAIIYKTCLFLSFSIFLNLLITFNLYHLFALYFL